MKMISIHKVSYLVDASAFLAEASFDDALCLCLYYLYWGYIISHVKICSHYLMLNILLVIPWYSNECVYVMFTTLVYNEACHVHYILEKSIL